MQVRLKTTDGAVFIGNVPEVGSVGVIEFRGRFFIYQTFSHRSEPPFVVFSETERRTVVEGEVAEVK